MATAVEQPVGDTPQAQAPYEEPPSPNSERVDQAIAETEKFLFDEYDGDKDGLMTRKEFFQFLWELKADPSHKLNEGQMISCWNAVDVNKNGSITFDEFRAGLEVCYDHAFFALENGATIPESIMITRGLVQPGEDLTNYNTVKFKKSVAVAFFDKVLEDEKLKKQQREEEKKAAATSSPFGERIPYRSRAERGEVASSSSIAYSGSPRASSAGSPANSATSYYPTRVTVRNSSAQPTDTRQIVAAQSYLAKAPVPAGRPGFVGQTLAKAQAEKEAKRLEAQRNIERIAAERYQEERRRREEERQRKEEEKKAAQQAQAAQSTEPEWKKNIRSRQTGSTAH